MRVRSSWLFPILAAVFAIVGSPVSADPEPKPDDVRAELARRREVAIQRLHDYGAAGVFPTDEHGLPLGVFRDAVGIRCPMSELIFQSGRADLVDHVVATDNRLKLATVHRGPLLDWMLASGLTQEEVVEIQGAMDINYSNFKFEGLNQNVRLVNAHDMVRTKIAGSEERLRENRQRSLELAMSRLSKQQKRQLVRN